MSIKSNRKVLLGEYVYDSDIGVLYLNSKRVEPRLTVTEASLLEFLYTHQDQIMSRDAILKHVAGDRVVSADIITQYIKTIRKALDDSVSNPRYIRTFPKQGYQFIAQVGEVEEKNLVKRVGFVTVFTLILFSLLVWFFWLKPEYIPLPPSYHALPITSLKGQEIDGDSTIDNQYLLFSHKAQGDKNWNLVIKSRSQERYIQLTHDEFNERRGKFSPSGKRIMYHRYDRDSNQIRVASLNWQTMKLEDDRLLLEFPKEYLSIYIDWKDEHNIFYSSKVSVDEPYNISEYNLDTLVRQDITYPENAGHGDLAISYSREAQKLAVLRNIGWSKTQIVIYDLRTKTTKMLISVPQLLYSIAWNSLGTQLIYRSARTELGYVDIESGETKALYKSNQPIYAPFKLGDSVGFMLGGLVTTDIVKYRLKKDATATPYLSSSFHDYLPTYAKKSGVLVFVSTRTGSLQIWLRDKNGMLRQISHFKQSPSLFDLAVDDEAHYVAYTINAELYLMDVGTGNILLTIGGENQEHNNPVFTPDGRNLIYTVKYKDEWYLEKRSLAQLEIPQLLTEGYLVKSSTEDNSLYFIKHNRPQLFKLTPLGEVIETPFSLGNIQFADQFQIIGKYIYYTIFSQGSNQLQRINMQTQEKINLFKMTSNRFTINLEDDSLYSIISGTSDTNLEVLQLN